MTSFAALVNGIIISGVEDVMSGGPGKTRQSDVSVHWDRSPCRTLRPTTRFWMIDQPRSGSLGDVRGLLPSIRCIQPSNGRRVARHQRYLRFLDLVIQSQIKPLHVGGAFRAAQHRGGRLGSVLSGHPLG